MLTADNLEQNFVPRYYCCGSKAPLQDASFKQMLVLKTKLFPVMLLACNVGSAVIYATAGEWKRAVYWGASSLCIAAITF